MNTVITLTVLIAKLTASVKGFTTRLVNLKTARKDIDAQMERLEKDLKNLWEREDIVKSYLRKFEKGTVKYQESASSLAILQKRSAKKGEEITELRKASHLNDLMVKNASMSLETVTRRLTKAQQNLVEAEAEAEIARIKAEKAARKAKKHASNRAHYRGLKEERRAKRNSSSQTTATMPENSELSEEAVKLADDLGANLDNPEDRAIVLSLLTTVQKSAQAA